MTSSMLIDCGLTKKNLNNSRLYCHNWDNETSEEWFERLKRLGFGAGLDGGEEKPHIYYFRWRRKAIYEERNAGKVFRLIGEAHGISTDRARQVYVQAQKQFGGLI